MSTGVERKLTTILAADAEGYSREMDADEVRVLGARRAAQAWHRQKKIEQIIHENLAAFA